MDELRVSPIMTSDTSPSPYIVSASSVYNTSWYPAWKAFDGGFSPTDSHWVSNVFPSWLMLDYGRKQRVDKYKIQVNSDILKSPKNWTFEGSNDSFVKDIDILDTRTNIAWKSSEIKIFEVLSPKEYRYYRIKVTANNGDTYLYIVELSMYINISNKFLISSGDGKTHSIQITSGKSEVPKMTSPTSPSGEVTTSNTYTPDGHYRAFDNDDTTFWQTNSPSINQWIQYKFVKKTVISSFALLISHLPYAPNNFKLQGSDDGIVFTNLGEEFSVTDWVVKTRRVFETKNKTPYLYYRILTLSTNSGNVIRIDSIELISPRVYEIKEIPSQTEQDFIKYGMDRVTILDLNEEIVLKSFVDSNQTTLGSGKVFSQKINTSKIPIKKVSIT
ncbi:discoidin domain-containing protein [Paenibacillus sp. N1-5-1-14]|uniref:discoidin domain-containing protein n=1 Tax=Paenibacillus radicibacter TaxID=2972488 RepID=UPI002158D1FE|nr:discoidin domain-containing protein [Paenibacillus radicibacter]MCR8641568.1 discoidin domain-containing protein [Paenibacillus radicibacter]